MWHWNGHKLTVNQTFTRRNTLKMYTWTPVLFPKTIQKPRWVKRSGTWKDGLGGLPFSSKISDFHTDFSPLFSGRLLELPYADIWTHKINHSRFVAFTNWCGHFKCETARYFLSQWKVILNLQKSPKAVNHSKVIRVELHNAVPNLQRVREHRNFKEFDKSYHFGGPYWVTGLKRHLVYLWQQWAFNGESHL